MWPWHGLPGRARRHTVLGSVILRRAPAHFKRRAIQWWMGNAITYAGGRSAARTRGDASFLERASWNAACLRLTGTVEHDRGTSHASVTAIHCSPVEARGSAKAVARRHLCQRARCGGRHSCRHERARWPRFGQARHRAREAAAQGVGASTGIGGAAGRFLLFLPPIRARNVVLTGPNAVALLARPARPLNRPSHSCAARRRGAWCGGR